MFLLDSFFFAFSMLDLLDVWCQGVCLKDMFKKEKALLEMKL